METKSFGQQLIDLLKQSVLVQAVITLAVIGATLYLVVVGRPVEDWLLQVLWLILGFYFGSKVGYLQGKPKE